MIEKLKQALEPLIKNCCKINAEPVSFSPQQADKTRFGGPAYLESEQEVKFCSQCQKPLTFVFQFRADPAANTGELTQFLYCFDCSPWGGKNEDGQWEIRVFKNPSPENFCDNSTGGDDIIPCVARVEKIKMLPDFETLEDLQHDAVALCQQINEEDPWDVYEETSMVMGCETEPISSVGGYPIWIQGICSKTCKICNQKMEFVAQIDSIPEAQLMWGDAGCVYIFRCKSHPQQFSIEMQCF